MSPLTVLFSLGGLIDSSLCARGARCLREAFWCWPPTRHRPANQSFYQRIQRHVDKE